MHDLEIRGAGEVLGEEQSGEMQQIGFQLYADMLKAAVSALRAGREPDLSQPLGVTTEINLHAPALLPEAYCSDVHERLVLYKRLANCETDRRARRAARGAGRPLRPAARAGAGAARVPSAAPRRAAARRARRSTPDPSARRCSSCKQPPFDAGKLILLVQKDGRIRFAGPDRMRIERAAPTLARSRRAGPRFPRQARHDAPRAP